MLSVLSSSARSDGGVTKIVGYGFSQLSSSLVRVELVMDFKKTWRLRFIAVIKKPGLPFIYMVTSKKFLPKKGFFHDFNQKLTQFPSKKLWLVNCRLA